MNSNILSLLVLAGIAIFLILRLRSVLGTRDGYEAPPTPMPSAKKAAPEFEVIEGGADRDITDHVEDGSDAAIALADMKQADADFNVSEFILGARGAYEMILMAYEGGDLADVKGFLDPDVFDAFSAGVAAREEQGLVIDASFVGIRETALEDAQFDPATKVADMTIRFVAELTSVVKDQSGEIVEGSATEIKRQRDSWTFSRRMGSSDPNWMLTATGD